MHWKMEEIQGLSKCVFGNSSDENVLAKVAELQNQLRKYENSFLGLHTKHEWAEVERLADEINQMLEPSYKADR